MPGLPVRVLRAPSAAAPSTRSRHHRRQLAAVAVAAVIATISIATPGRAPAVRAATPPEYHAIALGLLTNTNYVTVINESGSMGGYTKDNRLARIEGATVTPLSNVQNGYLSGISDDGTMVGYQNDQPIRVNGTTITQLSGLGTSFGYAAAIDRSAARIVGYSQVGSDQVGWLLEGGTTTPLPGLGGIYTSSYPSKINSAGLIAGLASDPNTGASRFVTWQNGVIHDLGDYGGSSASVYDLNDAGQMLVVFYVPGGDSHAAVYDGDVMTDLGTLGGQSTYAQDINNFGQIAMTSSDPDGHSHALLWQNGSFEDLGNLGGTDAYTNAINDQGQITGGYNTADGKSHGFLVDDGHMYDINDLLPPHTIQITGTGTITNSGYILAYSDAGTVLLAPGPTPPAAYDVIDLDTDSLGGNNDVGGIDMNASRQVVGAYDHGAFWFDGTTSAILVNPFEGGASAINENGVIVGGKQHNGQVEAFRFDGSIHFLGSLGGQGIAYDINDAGDVIGTAADSGGVNHAFLYRGGTFAPLPVPGGTASEGRRVNAGGTVIGFYYSGSFNGQDAHAFMSDGTTATDLGTLGGTYTLPQAINGAGEIVGQSRTASKDSVAFWYHGGTMTPIDPAGSTMSWTVDINENGQILGSQRDTSGNDRPFIYDHGTLTPIPGMGGTFMSATDISDRGQVVGYGSTGTASHAFIFDDGGLVDLNAAVPSGYEATIDYAVKINEDGTILAGATGAGHKRHVLLLVPTTPLPPLPVHATAAHPTVATVTSPNAGPVTVTEAATNDAPPVGSGYTFLGHQLNISAPASDPAHPISIVVKVDATLLASVTPNLTAADIAVFRDGVLVAACNPGPTDPPATPDPCVSLRETLSGGTDAGDAQITVLTSAASHWNVGFVATAPGAPTGATAVRGDKQATVSWTAPADTGHSQITGFTVTSSPGNKTATAAGNATSATVIGLTNGTSYTFTVTATNVVATGPASAPSNAVTPGNLLPQSITFVKPANQVLTTPTITVAPTASSGLTVALASTTPAICTVSGFDVSLVAVGTCSLTATQPGDGTYKAANPVTRTFTISQAPQTITFVKPANQLLTTPTITVAPTASSGLTVALASTTPAVCTVSGFDVSLIAVGTCSLTASEAGDTVYKAAAPVVRTFTISQASQTITFVKPANQVLTTPTITVAPTASSGLPVTLTSTTSLVCTVSGFDISLLKAGTCSITATQAGTAAYKAATPVARSFTVSKASQTITIPDPGPQSLGVHTVVLSPSASSGLTVALSSQTASVCTVSGNTVTLLKVGTCKVKGTQAGNTIYDPAPAIVRQFNVTT